MNLCPKENQDHDLDTNYLSNRGDLPAGNYMFKVNNKNTKTRCEICSKLTRKQQNDINAIVPMTLFLTLNIFRPLF